MEFKSILVPMDFSEQGNLALRRAAALASAQGANVTAMHVIEQLSYLGVPYVEPLSPDSQEKQREAAQSALDEAVSGIGVGAPKIDRRVVQGEPRQAILAQAEKTRADLIVMGATGRGRLSGMLMGSVSDYISRSADCSVLIVR